MMIQADSVVEFSSLVKALVCIIIGGVHICKRSVTNKQTKQRKIKKTPQSSMRSGNISFVLVTMMMTTTILMACCCGCSCVDAFVVKVSKPQHTRKYDLSSFVPSPTTFTTAKTQLAASTANNNNPKLSTLPKDISPFEKSNSKTRDIQGEFRQIALKSLIHALKDEKKTLEIEFPPLLGGEKSKSQFDDFDNVQELNKNRDWCIELLPDLSNALMNPGNGGGKGKQPLLWFVLPDLKEVELAKEEWGGRLYRQAAKFTCIEIVTKHYYSSLEDGKDDENNNSYAKPWGSTIASGISSLFFGGGGGNNNDDGDNSGLFGNPNALDDLTESSSASFHLVCQPGNGGPVEDWINVQKFHHYASSTTATSSDARSRPPATCIVNGALDKVRDGYYAPFIFPALAKTFDFYKGFEAVFFLKPISDKGVYGWLYRVYPEPWQVVLQTPTKDKRNNDQLVVVDTVALVSDTRPTYQECVNALLTTAADVQQ